VTQILKSPLERWFIGRYQKQRHYLSPQRVPPAFTRCFFLQWSRLFSHTSIAEVTALPHKQVTKLLHVLDAGGAHNETDQKENQKDNEQNPCNLGRGTGDAAETQNPANQSDDKKSNAPTQHIQFLLF
jgi:hypothetical protein